MKVHRLSTQAVGAIMMALQKSIAEQQDITDTMLGFELTEGANGLIVENPPVIDASKIEKLLEEQANLLRKEEHADV